MCTTICFRLFYPVGQSLFWQVSKGKMKIWIVLTREGYNSGVNKMPLEVFDILDCARGLKDLGRIEPKARRSVRDT